MSQWARWPGAPWLWAPRLSLQRGARVQVDFRRSKSMAALLKMCVFSGHAGLGHHGGYGGHGGGYGHGGGHHGGYGGVSGGYDDH